MVVSFVCACLAHVVSSRQAHYSTAAVLGREACVGGDAVYTFSLTTSAGGAATVPVVDSAASVAFQRQNWRTLRNQKREAVLQQMDAEAAALAGKARLVARK